MTVGGGTQGGAPEALGRVSAAEAILPRLPIAFQCSRHFPHWDTAGEQYLFWELRFHFGENIILLSFHVTYQSVSQAPAGFEILLSSGVLQFQGHHFMQLQEEGV